MSDSRERLGFIGLGLMGQPMARRLLGAGCAVTVWNRSPDKAAPLLAAGAETAASAANLAGAANIVFTCVTDTAALEAVVFGADGIAEADGVGKVLVDHSSIHPEAARAFAERLAATNGMSWIDAPSPAGSPAPRRGPWRSWPAAAPRASIGSGPTWTTSPPARPCWGPSGPGRRPSCATR